MTRADSMRHTASMVRSIWLRSMSVDGTAGVTTFGAFQLDQTIFHSAVANGTNLGRIAVRRRGFNYRTDLELGFRTRAARTRATQCGAALHPGDRFFF